MSIRPTLATAASAARPKRKRLKLLWSELKKESPGPPESVSRTLLHSLTLKMNRQFSKPGVIITFLPRSFLNLNGKEILFLVSRLCVYSPINIYNNFSHFFSLDLTYKLPLSPSH